MDSKGRVPPLPLQPVYRSSTTYEPTSSHFTTWFPPAPVLAPADVLPISRLLWVNEKTDAPPPPPPPGTFTSFSKLRVIFENFPLTCRTWFVAYTNYKICLAFC